MIQLQHLYKSLLLKIALFVFAICLFETCFAVILIQNTREDVLRKLYASRLVLLEDTGALDACDRHPETWSLPARGHGRVFALNAQGQALSAEGPERSFAQEVARVAVGTPVAVEDPSLTLAFVYRLGRPGPCNTFLLTPPPHALTNRSPLRRVLFIRILMLFVIVGSIVWLSARPLLRSVRRITQDAEEIVHNNFEGTLEAPDTEFHPLALVFNTTAREAKMRIEEETKRLEILYKLFEAISHDIRTPIASMKLAAGKLSSDQEREHAERTLRFEIEYIDALFANAATIARLRSSSLPFQMRPTNLSSLLERIAARFAVFAKDRDVALNISLPDDMIERKIDPLAMEQALSNLVHNAVKHADDHVAILLFERGDDVVFQVLNDGFGVPPEEIPKLTQWRYRSAHTEQEAGQGMGLSITLAIVERHGGTLNLARLDGGGVEAEIVLRPLPEDIWL